MIKIFISYSHKDEKLKEEFVTHLSLLKRKNIIEEWNDRKIVAGEDWECVINNSLELSDIVIFLVSSDFIASDYCYEKEVIKSIDSHSKGNKIVIPVILRECDWRETPFGKIQGLPKDAKPVISRHWHSSDEAFLDIINGLKKQITIMVKKKSEVSSIDAKYIDFSMEHKFLSPNNTHFIYQGQVLNGKPNGFGKAEFDNGDMYIGDWSNGNLDGYGSYFWKDETYYSGQWKEHKRTGFGMYYNKEAGRTRIGYFENDSFLEEKLLNEKEIANCSFCDGTNKNRAIILSGIDGNICNECVKQGYEVCQNELSKE